MGMLIVKKNANYKNANVEENLVRYVTRTRKNEIRKNELVAYGSLGMADDINLMLKQIKYVQTTFRDSKNIGRRMFHEMYTVLPEEYAVIGNSDEKLSQIARRCAKEYYDAGFQIVYAVHESETFGKHIHFAGNAVNFVTGKKYHISMKELEAKAERWNQQYFGDSTKKQIQQAIYFDSSIMKQEG